MEAAKACYRRVQDTGHAAEARTQSHAGSWNLRQPMKIWNEAALALGEADRGAAGKLPVPVLTTPPLTSTLTGSVVVRGHAVAGAHLALSETAGLLGRASAFAEGSASFATTAPDGTYRLDKLAAASHRAMAVALPGDYRNWQLTGVALPVQVAPGTAALPVLSLRFTPPPTPRPRMGTARGGVRPGSRPSTRPGERGAGRRSRGGRWRRGTTGVALVAAGRWASGGRAAAEAVRGRGGRVGRGLGEAELGTRATRSGDTPCLPSRSTWSAGSAPSTRRCTGCSSSISAAASTAASTSPARPSRTMTASGRTCWRRRGSCASRCSAGRAGTSSPTTTGWTASARRTGGPCAPSWPGTRSRPIRSAPTSSCSTASS